MNASSPHSVRVFELDGQHVEARRSFATALREGGDTRQAYSQYLRLAEQYPDRAARVMGLVREMHGGRDYASDWGRRMRGQGPFAEIIAQRFDLAARRLGLATAQSRLRCDLFRAPPRKGDQLSLF